MLYIHAAQPSNPRYVVYHIQMACLSAEGGHVGDAGQELLDELLLL